jgi:hypothetical protein
MAYKSARRCNRTTASQGRRYDILRKKPPIDPERMKNQVARLVI